MKSFLTQTAHRSNHQRCGCGLGFSFSLESERC